MEPRAVRACCAALALLACASAAPPGSAPAPPGPAPAPPGPAPRPPRYSSRIVHTHAGAIRGIIVEPASRRLEPVEAFLGVPYAAPPPRLAAPAPRARWPGTRLADAFAPVCPQRFPDISNKSAALARMPLGVYRSLLAAAPLLANQSEDCLFLNIYVPGSGARGVEAPYAVTVWLGGASHEWGSGNVLDAAALAARGRLLVITLNYRIGILGYLTSSAEDDPARKAGGAALLDVLAALRWTRAHVAAFGGDPARITLCAHEAGAALAGALLALPAAAPLLDRALLLSGSALAPAARAPLAALARAHAAQALRCSPDELAECVRARPLAALLAVEAPRARFLDGGWAPAPAPGGETAPSRALLASEAFLRAELAVVVATTESYRFFSEDEIRHGFEEEHRNRILRTYVGNVYRYHRSEIFAAVRNEYTDWEKPIQHPINIRDATLEALGDGAGAAPAARLAAAHARRGAPTYLAHFAHATRDADWPQRLGSTTEDTLTYFLGLPLVGGGGRNYSRADVAAAEACVALLASFAKSGEPALAPASTSASASAPAWPRYELNSQQYLSIGAKLRVKSHYRGHKMALWLHLIPALHRPGAAPKHHQFRQTEPDVPAGDLLPDLYGADDEEEAEADAGAEAGAEAEAEECSPAPAAARPAPPDPPGAPAPPPAPAHDSQLPIDSHYYSYTVALGVTVGAGCFLLALNVLLFAGIYLQRGRRRRRPRRDRDGSCRNSGGGAGMGGAEPSPRKSTLKRSCESELQERGPNAAGAGAVGAGGAPHKKRVQIQEISV